MHNYGSQSIPIGNKAIDSTIRYIRPLTIHCFNTSECLATFLKKPGGGTGLITFFLFLEKGDEILIYVQSLLFLFFPFQYSLFLHFSFLFLSNFSFSFFFPSIYRFPLFPLQSLLFFHISLHSLLCLLFHFNLSFFFSPLFFLFAIPFFSLQFLILLSFSSFFFFSLIFSFTSFLISNTFVPFSRRRGHEHWLADG